MKRPFIYLTVISFIVFLITIIDFDSQLTQTMSWNTIRVKFSIQAILLLFSSIIFIMIHFFRKK